MDENMLDKINQFLHGGMAPGEMKAFEEQLLHDVKLSELLSLYRSVVNLQNEHEASEKVKWQLADNLKRLNKKFFRSN